MPKKIRSEGGQPGNANGVVHGIWRSMLSDAEKQLWADLSSEPSRAVGDSIKFAMLQLRRVEVYERKLRRSGRLPLVEIESGGGEPERRTRRAPPLWDIKIRLLRTVARLAAVSAVVGALTDPEEHAKAVRRFLDLTREPFGKEGEDLPFAGQRPQGNGHADGHG